MNEIVRKQIEKAKSGKIIFLADEELSDDFFYEISKLTHLEKLNLFGCKFKDIPDSFSNLINLEALELTENSFQELPLVITKLPKLKHLTVSFGNLTTLPPEFERLKELEYLDISVNPFTFTTSLNVISKFKKLKDLNMSFIPLKDFSVLRNLANLETLSLNGCNLSKLFLEISFLKKLRYLELYKNNFTEFPIQLVNLINLESLDLSENQLSSLPTEINRLQKLETISLRNNNFHKFPTQLLDLPNLKRPLISNNPFSINELKFEYSISVEKRKFTSLNLKGLHFKDISPPYEILYLEDKNNAILLSPELSINDDTFDFLIQVFGNDKTKKTILKKIRDRIETWIINEKIEFENKIKIDEKFKKEKEVNFIRRFFYYPKKDNKKYLEVRIDFDRLIRFGESGENTYFADWRKIPVKDLLDYVGVDDNELTKENIKQEWKGKAFLTEIKINNFKIFNQLEFTLSEHFNIILGRNGLGKTSILQAITLGLLPLANIDKSNNFEEYIRFRADNSEIILNWGDEYRRTYIFKNELNEEEYVNFPQKLILAYGVNLNTNPELDHSEIVDKILNGNALSYSTKSIFSDYATNFHDPLVILEKLILARDESNKYTIDSIIELFAYILNHYLELIEESGSIHIEGKGIIFNSEEASRRGFLSTAKLSKSKSAQLPKASFSKSAQSPKASFSKSARLTNSLMTVESNFYFIDINGNQLKTRHLSEGYRDHILLVTDILIRILASRNEIFGKENVEITPQFFKEVNGVILIDEFDRHLHPVWQRKLLSRFKEDFPKIQFILTTHNPFSVQSAVGANAIELVVEDKTIKTVNKTIESRNILSIIREYFTKDFFDYETQEQMKQFSKYLDEIDEGKIDLAYSQEFRNVVISISEKSDELKSIIGSQLLQLNATLKKLNHKEFEL